MYKKNRVEWDKVCQDLIPEVLQKNKMTPKQITANKIYEKMKDIKILIRIYAYMLTYLEINFHKTVRINYKTKRIPIVLMSLYSLKIKIYYR